jgi:hypothetical protein
MPPGLSQHDFSGAVSAICNMLIIPVRDEPLHSLKKKKPKKLTKKKKKKKKDQRSDPYLLS